ncbi:MAG: VCBS repeat-containing protein, partial [Planctomycetaceae bacterium]|nr:VCBS repeat-containing protein [Planctomycetaceae bacterium]
MILRYCFCMALFCLVAGCGSQSTVQPPSTVGQKADDSPSPIRFVDRTEALGIDFVYQNDEAANRYTILESIGGGVAIFDYDLNGLDDLLFPGGGSFPAENQLSGLPTALFSQVSPSQFVNQSQSSGIAPSRYYSHGCSVADYDNDGFPDVVITGYGGILCWHNLGDGTFEEVSVRSHLIDPSWSTSAGWGDLNGDGALDLYLTHYVDWSFENDPRCGDDVKPRDVCPPRSFKGLDDRVFFSNGDGTFYDATEEAGLIAAGKGLGVVLGDLDGDLDLDIYVGNDTTDNFLYLNQGQGNFQEAAMIHGVAVDDEAVANGSMGVDIGDYNRDGLPDLWVANYEADRFALYKNIGKGQFLYASRESGIG